MVCAGMGVWGGEAYKKRRKHAARNHSRRHIVLASRLFKTSQTHKNRVRMLTCHTPAPDTIRLGHSRNLLPQISLIIPHRPPFVKGKTKEKSMCCRVAMDVRGKNRKGKRTICLRSAGIESPVPLQQTGIKNSDFFEKSYCNFRANVV